jgi:hypothetical protein
MTTHIKNTLSFLLKAEKAEEDWRLNLLNNWHEVVGNLNDKMRLEKIQGETLIIGVYDSNWMQELYLLSRPLIKTINTYLKKAYITELRFKAACKTKPVTKKTTAPQKTTHQPIPLKPKEIQALEKIDDPELRCVLQQFLGRCQT